MMAVHVFGTMNADRTPTTATLLAAGRSAATFALIAGVGLAFMTGGRRPPQGHARRTAAAGIAVRALVIGLIGLILGAMVPEIYVILVYYAAFFLLAIPLLWLRPGVLAAIAAGFAVLGPVLVVASFSDESPFSGLGDNPTIGAVLDEPSAVVADLLVTGYYPAVVFLAYVCAGLAIGRLDLASTRVAGALFGGGLLLAVSAWLTSSLLLFRLGGLEQLRAAAPRRLDAESATNVILWDPRSVDTWWWLALRAPHSAGLFDVLHTLGAAIAVLGAALLVTRIRGVARLLKPLALAGAMTLTLYSAHLLVLATGLLAGYPYAQYLLLVVAALGFAVVWRRWRERGPLEALVAAAAQRVRVRGGAGT